MAEDRLLLSPETIAMDRENISTENQPKGSARNQSDILDRESEDVAPGQREWSADSKKKPEDRAKSAMEDAGSPGGTGGTGGTNHEQDD
jgi:hypothetical protein